MTQSIKFPDGIKGEIIASGYPLPRPLRRDVYIGAVPFLTTIKDASTAEQSITSDAAFAPAAPLIERFLGNNVAQLKQIRAVIWGVRAEAVLTADSQLLQQELRRSLCLRATNGQGTDTRNIGRALCGAGFLQDMAAGAGTGTYSNGYNPNYFMPLPQPMILDFMQAVSVLTYVSTNIAGDLACNLFLDGIWTSYAGSNVEDKCDGAMTPEEAKAHGQARLLHYHAK